MLTSSIRNSINHLGWVLIASIFCCLSVTKVEALLDLDDFTADFIVESKKIDVPGYPDAFNPCLIRWKGSILMTFRFREQETGSTNNVGFVWLDDNFNVISPPTLLHIRHSKNVLGPIQDVRMVVKDDKLLIVYSNRIKQQEELIYRMFIAEVVYDGICFSAKKPVPLLHFEGTQRNREKNWMPFQYNNELFLIYSASPQTIMRPLLASKSCETVCSTENSIKWGWGEVRGGTPAHLIGDEYLAFFHSCITLRTAQSEGKPMWHYVMGAYTFEASPPFAATSMSTVPIVGKKFYSGPLHKTWKPLRVVFPVGYIFDEKYIWLSYGRQDHEAWVVKINIAKLKNSLTPVHTVE